MSETTMLLVAAGEMLGVDLGAGQLQVWMEAWGWGMAMGSGRSCTHHHAPTPGDYPMRCLQEGYCPKKRVSTPKLQL